MTDLSDTRVVVGMIGSFAKTEQRGAGKGGWVQAIWSPKNSGGAFVRARESTVGPVPSTRRTSLSRLESRETTLTNLASASAASVILP